ncbi:MAG: hypothetical protein JJ848_000430 [Prochlorococcus marinus CUG1439]|uniref:hypothetical protein n=1 Tax=Prochlorococcus sp. MIT 1314 TaxID=3096220 RepID=UPI001B2D3004|nr:hypothetical protein [Prochlorococcus sp. MIT 1314]MCR8538807.1 hypothetical protein [Prochlorococcus marinus CUG1439]
MSNKILNSIRKTITINVLVFTTLIFAIEILLGICILIRNYNKERNIIPGKLQFQISGTTGHKRILDNKSKLLLSKYKIYDEINDQRSIKSFKKSNSKKNIKLLTLGGSTSDPLGFMYSGIDGNWTLQLGKLFLKKNISSEIHNYAQGGFNSSQELISFIKSSKIVNPDIILSLSGINEYYFIRNNYLKDDKNIYQSDIYTKGENGYRGNKIIFGNNKFLKCNFICFDVNYKSNIRRFINYIQAKKIINSNSKITHLKINEEDFIKYKNANITSIKRASNIFISNHESINLLAKKMNRNYYLFLQPTIYVENINDLIFSEKSIYEYLKKNFPYEDPKVIAQISKKEKYIFSMNLLYKELRKECAERDFCFDISNILVGNSTKVYKDARHPNAIGNRIISKEILSKIEL